MGGLSRGGSVLTASDEPPGRYARYRRPEARLPVRRASTPLMGYRVWALGVTSPAAAPALIAPVIGSPWVGPVIEAECAPRRVRSRGHDGPAPALECSCGIYALKRLPTRAMQRHRVVRQQHGVVVAGRIAMSGRVIEGTFGYRAQHARVVGPLEVLWTCPGTLDGELFSWSTRTSTWERVPQGRCPFDLSRFVLSRGRLVGLCAVHVEEGAAPLPALGRDPVLSLQARLELRYGVDVVIQRGGIQWT